MFEDIDRMDAVAWAGWLADDARFRFGNGDETTTRDAARIGQREHEARQGFLTPGLHPARP